VTREAVPEGQHGVLQDGWEPLVGPQSVQTPAMVYQQLRGQGFHVTYYRVPVTDGTAPSVRHPPCRLARLPVSCGTAGLSVRRYVALAA
jgi:hypothetical protein